VPKPRIPAGVIAGTVVVGLLAVAPTANAATYSSGKVDRRIPQVGLAKSKIKVPQGSNITDVNVSVRISHTYTPDLIVGVQGPKENDGFQELANREGGTGFENDKHFGSGKKSCKGNFTVFDDEAATPLSSGDNPFAGSFEPSEQLGEYDDESARGTWTLYVFDVNQHDSGTLHCWKLDIDTT
jgi:subtilisin-like proprotein convertase family protein